MPGSTASSGKVEQINLRTIVLRDGEGAVQVFPNGTVTALANLSKLFAYAIVDVRVAYSENLDRVNGTIREIGKSMALDPAWQPLLLEPIEILGVDSIADGAITIRVRFKTAPLHQGQVANELRRRLVGALVGRGIRPYAGRETEATLGPFRTSYGLHPLQPADLKHCGAASRRIGSRRARARQMATGRPVRRINDRGL